MSASQVGQLHEDGQRVNDLATYDAEFDELNALVEGSGGSTSAQALLAMAQQRLQSLDDQLAMLLNKMNDASSKMAAIRAVNAGIHNYQTLHQGDNNAKGQINTDAHGHVTGSNTVVFDLDAPAEPLVQVPDETDPTKTRPKTWREVLGDGGITIPPGTRYYNLDNISNLLDTLKEGAQSLSDGQEELSLRLQEAVSRRGQFTQLVSQLLASERDTAHAILQNTH